MEIRGSLKESKTLLGNLLEFISQDDAKVIQNWNNRFEHEWLSKVQALSFEKRFIFDGLRDYSLIQDSNWLELISNIKMLSDVPSAVEKIESLDIQPPGNKKKQHELKTLLQFFQNDRNQKIADFGGGVGNSSAFLMEQLEWQPTILEGNEELIKKGKKKFKNRLNYIHGMIDSNFSSKELSHCDMAFGLHTCGNFAVDMMNSCMEAKIPKIVNFGCCYSKIEDERYYVSQENKPFELNRRALSAGTLSFDKTTKDFYEFRLKIMDYKYSFYHLFFKEYGEVKFQAMSNSRRSLYQLSFFEFYQMTMKRFFPEKKLLSEEEVMGFFNSRENRELLSYFQSYYAISRYIGELVESYILLDRAKMGENAGYKASILKFFDPLISPRCKGIILES